MLAKVKQMFPSWRFNTDGREQLVNNAEEDAALGPGWTNGDAPDRIMPEDDDEVIAASAPPAKVLYPSWRAHANGTERLVHNEGQDKAAAADGYVRVEDLAPVAAVEAVVESVAEVEDVPVNGKRGRK